MLLVGLQLQLAKTDAFYFPYADDHGLLLARESIQIGKDFQGLSEASLQTRNGNRQSS
jgi:hypothetical protein